MQHIIVKAGVTTNGGSMKDTIEYITEAYKVDPKCYILIDYSLYLHTNTIGTKYLIRVNSISDRKYLIYGDILAVDNFLYEDYMQHKFYSWNIQNAVLFDINYHPPLLINWEYISEEYKKTILGTI